MPARQTRAGMLAWLGTGLLVLNLWAAALIPGGAVAAAESGLGLEICTLHGVVKLDASGHELPPTGQQHQHSAELCQCCLSLLNGGFEPATAPVLPAPRSVAIVLASAIPPPAIQASRPRESAQPRAPPAV